MLNNLISILFFKGWLVVGCWLMGGGW